MQVDLLLVCTLQRPYVMVGKVRLSMVGHEGLFGPSPLDVLVEHADRTTEKRPIVATVNHARSVTRSRASQTHLKSAVDLELRRWANSLPRDLHHVAVRTDDHEPVDVNLPTESHLNSTPGDLDVDLILRPDLKPL